MNGTNCFEAFPVQPLTPALDLSHSPSLTLPTDEQAEKTLQFHRLAQHQSELIELFRAGFYFQDASKTQLDWEITDFALRNSANPRDVSVKTRFALLKWAATKDFATMVAFIRIAPVKWEVCSKSGWQPRLSLKQVSIHCEFIIPAQYGKSAYPGVIVRAQANPPLSTPRQ